jgi:hypothetical protein
MKREKQLKSARGREFIKKIIFWSARWTHIRQPADIGSNPFSATFLRKVKRNFPLFIQLVGLISASRRTLGTNPFSIDLLLWKLGLSKCYCQSIANN